MGIFVPCSHKTLGLKGLYIFLISVCCLITVVYAQPTLTDWRKVSPSAYEQGVLQIRLSPLAVQTLRQQGGLPGKNGFLGNATLDSLERVFGFVEIKQLADIALKPTKLGNDPAVNPVFRWYRITLQNPKALLPALDALEKCKPWVEIAEPVYKVELHGPVDQPFFEWQWFPEDSLFSGQWHYHNTGQTGGTPDADIDLPEAWEIERGHPSVLVGVLDNGIDTQHVDLKPNLSEIRGFNFFNNQNGLVPGNHGNHTSGTIGAASNNVYWVSGIAGGDGTPSSGIRLVSCQVFGVPSGSGGIENAFIWSAQNGVAISSNSWGYSQPNIYNQSVLDAIDYFIENGGGNVLKNGLVIFSGGNSGNYEQRYPGVYERVIGVTATNHHDKKAWYATIHEKMDITAPGGETNAYSGGPAVNGGRGGVLSTIIQAGGAVGYLQGTSMAAPHVAGVAALVASHGRGRLSADDVKSILLTQTDPIDQLQFDWVMGRMGTGRLNAFKAISLAHQLVQLPEILAPSRLSAQPSCGDIELNWVKGNETDSVMVAVSTEPNRGGLFGVPVGSYSAGDTLLGGGRIIYKGTGSSFRFTGGKEGISYYFKIWTEGPGNAYSMGIVNGTGVSIGSPVQSFEAMDSCYQFIDLSWAFEDGCPEREVMVAFNTQNSFGNPSGNYNPGDMLGEAQVVYKGTGLSFRHDFSANTDSATLYYRLYALVAQGGYGQPISAQTSTPAAVTLAYPKSTESNSVLCAWQKNPCFSGDVLVAWNTSGGFGEPSGPLNPGGTFGNGNDTVLYKGPLSEFLHAGLQPNTQYFYGVWPLFNGGYGLPKFFATKTRCNNTTVMLPFRDSIGLQSLSGCTLDTLGVWNFTAGPLPVLRVVNGGENPSAPPFRGGYMLAFNSYETRERNEVWLTTPPLVSTGHPLVDVAFKWYEDNTEYASEYFKPEGIHLLWSTDYINWDTVAVYPRITQYGQNGWKYKQVTLPPAAGNQPALYVRWAFRSAWGYNCFLDEISVLPTQPKRADGMFSIAMAQFTDSLAGVTHFYSANEELLLTINGTKEFLGHVHDSLAVGIGGTEAAQKIGPGNNYVANPGGWAVTGKYWHVDKWVEPTQPVSLVSYYHASELQSLEALAGSGFTPIAPSQSMPLVAYQLNSTSPEATDPLSGHQGIPVATAFGQAGFWQTDSLATLDSLNFTWRPPYLQNWQAIEQVLPKAGGGGLGKGSLMGNGALLPYWVTLRATRTNKTTVLDWTTGYERNWILMAAERASGMDTVFQTVGYLSPAGWSQQGGNYTITDGQLLPNGLYRYRIKAFDKNSGVYVSPEVQVRVEDTKGVVVFPNPVAGGNARVFAERPMEMLRLMDVTGKLLFSSKPGTTSYLLQLPNLPKATYFLQVFMYGKVITTKVLVQ